MNMPNNNDCKNCSNIQWKNHYLMAQQRFDRVIARIAMGNIIAFTIAILCLIATICVILKFEKFIKEFEYVEETEIQIEQDWRGDNRVILDDGTEVISNGAEIYGENQEVLAKEKNKVNTININR